MLDWFGLATGGPTPRDMDGRTLVRLECGTHRRIGMEEMVRPSTQKAKSASRETMLMETEQEERCGGRCWVDGVGDTRRLASRKGSTRAGQGGDETMLEASGANSWVDQTWTAQPGVGARGFPLVSLFDRQRATDSRSIGPDRWVSFPIPKGLKRASNPGRRRASHTDHWNPPCRKPCAK